MNKNIQAIKEQTIELYRQLPQDKAKRITCHTIRDKIIELNSAFFNYVAIHTYIKNSSVEYEDKVQCSLLIFCNIWWQYMWDGLGDDSGHRPNGYPHQGISFTSFFLPRLSSRIRTELQEVPYTVRRTTLCKIGRLLNKKWTEVTLEDLDRVTIPYVDLRIARMVLDPNYKANFDYEVNSYIHNNYDISSNILNPEDYDTLEEMLIHETIEKEDRLTNKEIKYLANILELDYRRLIDLYPKALTVLAERLKETIQAQQDMFEILPM